MRITMYKFFFVLFASFQFLQAVEVSIDTKNYSNLPTTATQVDAVLLDKSGTMSESQATFNPATGTINVDIEPGPNASIFLPDFGDRYLWRDGHWVNKAGYYYQNGTPVSIGVADWDSHWNNYWNHTWHDNWHRYYDNHPGNRTGWRGNRDWNHHWHDHSRYHHNHHGDHRHSGSHHHGSHHHSHHSGHHGGHHK